MFFIIMFYFSHFTAWKFLSLNYFCPLTMLFLAYQSLVKLSIIKSFSGCHLKKAVVTQSAIHYEYPGHHCGFALKKLLTFQVFPELWFLLIILFLSSKYLGTANVAAVCRSLNGWTCRNSFSFYVQFKSIFLMLR